jgi:hypothetical protein
LNDLERPELDARLYGLQSSVRRSTGFTQDRLLTLREAFAKMLRDPNFVAEAKKLVDWNGIG